MPFAISANSFHVDGSANEVGDQEKMKQAEFQDNYPSEKSIESKLNEEKVLIDHMIKHNFDETGGSSTIFDSEEGTTVAVKNTQD